VNHGKVYMNVTEAPHPAMLITHGSISVSLMVFPFNSISLIPSGPAQQHPARHQKPSQKNAHLFSSTNRSV